MTARVLPETRAVLAIRVATHGDAVQGTTVVPSSELIKAIASAIRSAEAAAYERVVDNFERLRSTVTPINGTPAKWAADAVRSLAKNGGGR